METITNGATQTNKFQFSELVLNGFYNRGNIVNALKLNKGDYEGKKDSAISMFSFTEDYFKYTVEHNNSVSGYNGVHSFIYLYVDFDFGADISKVREDVVNFITYGLSNFLDEKEFSSLRIYYSGSKGFHLAIPRRFFTSIKPSRDLCFRAEAFVKHIAELTGGETTAINSIDYGQYKNCTLLIRLPNTINTKTGLYKIPLSYAELCNFTIDEIKEKAKRKREIEYSNNVIVPNEALTEKFNEVKIGSAEKIKHIISNGYLLKPVESERNNHAYTIALHYAKLGDKEENILNILNDWNSKNQEPLPEDEIKSCLKSAIKKAGMSSKEIDRTCFMNFEDRKNNYADYIKDISNKKIDIGFKLIDEKLRGLRPGNVLTLLAETGIGKSSIVQNILQGYTKKTGNVTLYLSLEMDNYEMHERESQIEFNVSGYEVEEAYSTNTANYNSDHLNKFITLANSIDVNRLPEYVEKCTEHFGDIGLITIDHIGLMDNKIHNESEYSRLTDVMKKIKSFALTYKYPVICISQVNRFEALKKSDRLSLFSGKGSGEVENSSNVVLALEKITYENYKIFGYDEKILNYEEIEKRIKSGFNLLCMSILKNRRGGYTQVILEYNRYNLRISESDLNKTTN